MNIHKAQRTALAVPDLLVTATDPVPNGLSVEDLTNIFEKDAAALCERLLASLPGGTVDQLLLHLLRHKASRLRITHRTETP